jgi:hypothetical protein
VHVPHQSQLSRTDRDLHFNAAAGSAPEMT